MAGIKTLLILSTMATVEEQFTFTLVRIRRNEHTKDLIAEVEAFEPNITSARGVENALVLADAEANAGAFFADMGLDDSADFVWDNTDRKSLLSVNLFGDLRRSELKRPILGGQLAIMTTWPATLAQAEKDVLKAHVPLLTQRVETGVAADAERKSTAQKLTDFRTVGQRAKLIEDFNAFRKSLYGKLADIQHKKSLPSGWAESFFMQDSSEGLSVAELNRRIGALSAELEVRTKQRDAMLAEEKKIADAKAAARRTEKKSALDALKNARLEIEAKEKALQAELDQDDAPKEP